MTDIVPLEEKHIDGCADVYMTVFNSEPYYDHWTKETARQRINELRHTPGFMGYVAVDGDEVVGLIMGYKRQWYNGISFDLQDVCVLPKRQGRGIGSQLCDVLEHELAQQEVKRVFLMTLRGGPGDVFYSRRNFRQASRTIVMVKRLSDEQ